MEVAVSKQIFHGLGRFWGRFWTLEFASFVTASAAFVRRAFVFEVVVPATSTALEEKGSSF